MHIGFLTPEYPHMTKTFGGIATSIKTLALALIKKGHTVTVFLYGREEDGIDFDENIKIISIKMKKKKGLTWWTNRKYIQSIINDEVQNNHLQLLEAADWTGITAFMKLKCPLVIRLHGSDTYFCHIEQRHQKYKNYFFEKRALHGADHIVSVSRYTAELTKKLFALTKEISVIYNGIDVESFSLKKTIHSTEEDSIVYLGTLVRKKGVLELPYIFNEVIKKRPNARLYIVGADAPDITTDSLSTWELMKRLFSQEALARVDYLGKVPHENVRTYIDRVTLCVFPSFAEAFPVSWLESMACSKPIVASDIGWAAESIENGISGLLESPDNHSKYADKIIQIMSNDTLANDLGNNAYLRVKTYFDADSIAIQNIAYFNKIIEKKK